MAIAWTTAARADVNAAWDFLEAENPAAAELFDSRILGGVASLIEFPPLGRPGRVAGTRELVIGGLTYIVVYRARHDRVEVLRVLHTARSRPPGAINSTPGRG